MQYDCSIEYNGRVYLPVPQPISTIGRNGNLSVVDEEEEVGVVDDSVRLLLLLLDTDKEEEDGITCIASNKYRTPSIGCSGRPCS